MINRWLVSAVFATATLVACGGADKSAESGEKPAEVAADAPMLERPEANTMLQSNAPDMGEAVTEIRIVDDSVGSGLAATHDDILTVHYHGWIYNPDSSDHKGTLFDRSKIRGPFKFRLGAGRVIRGWEHGLLGMRQGGKRTLFIPAHMGYADRGVPGLIPPNSALLFEVELLDVNRG